jgi:hypothetical protein
MIQCRFAFAARVGAVAPGYAPARKTKFWAELCKMLRMSNRVFVGLSAASLFLLVLILRFKPVKKKSGRLHKR